MILNSILNIPFKTVNVTSKENMPKHINDIENILKINAISKILAYIEKENISKNQILLSSDTLVSIPDKNLIFGKIEHKNIKLFKLLAKEQLYFLLGKEQVVYTSIALFGIRNNKYYSDCVKTKLIFRKISKETEDIIDYYINLKEEGRGPLGKAGGYGLQEPEILMLAKEVIGDPGIVIGLPIYNTHKLLIKCGIKKGLNKININKIYENIWGKNIWKKQKYFIPESLIKDKNVLNGNFAPMAKEKIKAK
jgi:predicted house-cleaning NTP pyrophosphatase (Maf/HAM1 superfamily)